MGSGTGMPMALNKILISRLRGVWGRLAADAKSEIRIRSIQASVLMSSPKIDGHAIRCVDFDNLAKCWQLTLGILITYKHMPRNPWALAYREVCSRIRIYPPDLPTKPSSVAYLGCLTWDINFKFTYNICSKSNETKDITS